MKFSELARSLKEALFPVYLIEGEEAYFRDHAVKSIRAACNIAQPALNDVRYEGELLKGDKLSAFRDGLYTLPFFDNKRLVRVYEFYPTEREWENVLKGYCERPCESTVLVIVNRGKKAGAAELKRRGGVTYVDCSREDEETLAKWVFGVCRRLGLDIDADAAALLVRYCARDCARMRAEAEKFLLLLGEGGKITRALIEENVAKDAEYKIYELTQAASRGNHATFTEILYDLREKGYDENAALASLTSHFRTLSEIANMKGSDAEIGKVLGLKPYAVQKNRELISRLGRQRVKELYISLFELSSGAKQGKYNKTNALIVAMAKIFFA